MVNNDENQVVPPLVEVGADLAARDAMVSQENAHNQVLAQTDQDMDVDHPPVTMMFGWHVCRSSCMFYFNIFFSTSIDLEYLALCFMTTAHQMSPTLVVEFSVHFTIIYMVPTAGFVIVSLKRLQVLKLVNQHQTQWRKYLAGALAIKH